MKSILALIAVALALTSVSALACDGSGGKMKGADNKGGATSSQGTKS